MSIIDNTTLEATPPRPPASDFNETKFLAWAKNQLQKAKTDRTQFERQWYLNLAFYSGRQWVSWSESQNFDFARLLEAPRRPWEVRLTVNKIRPRIQKMLFKLNQEKPRGFVQPATTDTDDIAGSRAAEVIYEYVITQECKQDAQMINADWWALICGTSFIKVYWDSYSSTPKICMDPMSPFHIFVPDMEVLDIQQQPWICHASIRAVDELKLEFPDADIEPTTSSNSGNILNDRFLQGLGIRQNTAKNATTYYEMWIKPNNDYPEGVKVCWVKDQVLDVVPGNGIPPEEPELNEDGLPVDAEGNLIDPASLDPGTASPFINGLFPFAKRTYMHSGKFYGESPIVDMIPPQMEYNKARSQMIENRNLTSRPQYRAPRGSMQVSKITNEPGIIHEYAPGLGPLEVLEPAGMPAYITHDIAMTVADIDEMSSMGDINRGDAPGRVEAASAIAFLQEENDSILAISAWDKERAIESLGNMILNLVQQHWDSRRQISVVGRNQAWEAYQFSGADLNGQTNYQVVAGSGQPVARSAKQAFILELMDKGAITAAQGLKYLALGDAAKLHEEMRTDENHAERENLKLSKGEMVQVHPYDNDLIHIQSHDDYAKTQEFENLEPQFQAMIRMHIYQQLFQLVQKAGMLATIPPDIMARANQEAQAAMQQQQMPQPNLEMELEFRRIYTLLLANNGLPPMPNPTQGGSIQGEV